MYKHNISFFGKVSDYQVNDKQVNLRNVIIKTPIDFHIDKRLFAHVLITKSQYRRLCKMFDFNYGERIMGVSCIFPSNDKICLVCSELYIIKFPGKNFLHCHHYNGLPLHTCSDCGNEKFKITG